MNFKESLRHLVFIFIIAEIFIGSLIFFILLNCYWQGFCVGYALDFDYMINSLNNFGSNSRAIAWVYTIQFILLFPLIILASSYFGNSWRRVIGLNQFQIKKLTLPFLLFATVFAVFLSLDIEVGDSDFLNGAFNEFDLFFAFSVVFLAPVLEEFVFRGYLQSFFIKLSKSNIFSSVLVSILFCAVHMSQYGGLVFVYVFLLSLIICYARLVTGSLYPAILIHFLNNLISVMYFYNLNT